MSKLQSTVATPGFSSPGVADLHRDRPYFFDKTDPFDKHLQQHDDRGSNY